MARLGRSYPARIKRASRGAVPPTLFVWTAASIDQTNFVGVSIGSIPFQQYQTGGSGADTWSSAPANTPVGINFDTNTGIYTGTPTTATSYPITVTAFNGAGPSAKAFTWLIVKVPPSWTQPFPGQTSPVNVAITNIDVNTLGIVAGTPPFTWTAVLPSGLSIGPATGIISGTPDTPGNVSTYTITATNGASPPSATSAAFNWTITSTPPTWPASIATQTSSIGVAITPFDIATLVTGTPPIVYTDAVPTFLLPTNLVISSAGLITGIPNGAARTVAVKIRATGPGAVVVDSPAFNWILNESPVWQQPDAQTSVTGVPDSYDPRPKLSGTPPFVFSIPGTTPLPNGLSILDSSTGVISGTPIVAGTFNPTILATNNGGANSSTSPPFAWVVSTVVSWPNTPDLPGRSSFVGVAISPFSIASSAAGTQPITFTSTGHPTGIQFDNNTGTYSGTPSGPANSFSVSVIGFNAASPGGVPALPPFTWTISDIAPALAPISPPPVGYVTGPGNINFSTFLTAGTQPVTYTAPGTGMPQGLTLNPDGSVVGTHTLAYAGKTTTIFAANANPTPASQTFTWVVNTIPAWSPTPLVNQTSIQGQADSYNVGPSVVAGTTPFTFSITSGFVLPTGMTIDVNTGNIFGTPTAVESLAVQVTVTNATGVLVTSNTFTWTVNQLVVWGAMPAPTTTTGGSANLDVSLLRTVPGNGVITYGFTGNLPTGASLNTTTGLITGTLGVPSVYTSQITATNAAGTATSGNLVWTVQLAAPLLVIPNQATSENIDSFSQDLNQFNTGGVSTNWTKSNGLNFLTLSTGGILSGTVTTREGSYTTNVTATNASGSSQVPYNLTITSGDPTPINQPIPTQSDVVGVNIPGRSFAGYFAGATSYGATGLPSPLTMNAAGVVSGTPNVVGSTTTQVTAANTHGSLLSNSFTWTITAAATAPVWNAIAPQSSVAGSSPTLTVSATGSPPITYTDDVAGFLLPAGLVINASTGAITGTLTAAVNTYSVKLRASNSVAPAGVVSAIFTWTVTAVPTPPILNLPPSFTFPENVGGNGALNLNLAIYNPVPPGGLATSWNIGSGAPPGSTIDANGIFSTNILTREGTWSIQITASNADGQSTDTFLLIVTSSNPTTPIGPPISQTNTIGDSPMVPMATYIVGATSYSATVGLPNGVPNGMSINTSTGVISGTVSVTGIFNPIVTGTNPSGSTSLTWQWVVQPVPVAGSKRYGRVSPVTLR